MLDKQAIESIRSQVAPHESPVLSLYLNVNPAEPGNQQKASVLRARAALETVSIPDSLRTEVLRRLEQDHVIPGGRSLVLFSGEDPSELFSVNYIHKELPLLDLDDTDGTLVRWGQPFVAPLLFAADQTERYAAIYVSQHMVRLFEVFMGDIREVWTSERDLDKDEWRRRTEAQHSPGVGKAVTARGGRDVDTHSDRVEMNTARWYSEVVQQFRDDDLSDDADRVILLGTPDAIKAFTEALTDKLRDRVVATLPAPSDDQADASAWYPLLEDSVHKAEADHERELLDQIRERGSWGLDEVLNLLNNGQVDVLAMPWQVGQNVWLAKESGAVARTPAPLETRFPDDTLVETKLKDALPSIVERSSVRVEFVAGENADRLRDEFAGIAALRRW